MAAEEKETITYAVTDPELKKIYGDTITFEAVPRDRPVGDGFYYRGIGMRSCGGCTMAGLPTICSYSPNNLLRMIRTQTPKGEKYDKT